MDWFLGLHPCKKFTFHWNKICSKNGVSRGYVLTSNHFCIRWDVHRHSTWHNIPGSDFAVYCLESPRHFQPIVYLSNSQQGRAPPARESLLGDGTTEQDGWSKPNSSGTRWSSIPKKNSVFFIVESPIFYRILLFLNSDCPDVLGFDGRSNWKSKVLEQSLENLRSCCKESQVKGWLVRESRGISGNFTWHFSNDLRGRPYVTLYIWGMFARTLPILFIICLYVLYISISFACMPTFTHLYLIWT